MRPVLRLTTIFVLVSFFAGSNQAPMAHTARSTISAEEALTKIRSAHILKPQTVINLTFNDKQATVLVERPQDESDNDCKIDGVFVAKALIDAYPSAITSVRIFFSKDGSNAIELAISAIQLKDYASGKIDRHALLDFITVNKVKLTTSVGDPVQATPPTTTTTYPRIAKRIEEYEARGIDMSKYHRQLAQLRQFTEDHNFKATRAIRLQLLKELHLSP